MDANQTRLHVLLGRDDWSRCREWLGDSPPQAGELLSICWNTSSSPPNSCDVNWVAERNEVTLRPTAFHFAASAVDRAPKLGSASDYSTSDRRGAARDRFGNWYFISQNRREIRVFSAGCKHTTRFWSCDGKQLIEPKQHGTFASLETPRPPPPGELSGLAITEDHYLVVGTLGPGERGGLLVFDLHADGPPRHSCWPEDVSFCPFDMAPRRRGGVWILDRTNRHLWALDRHLRVMSPKEIAHAGNEPDVFQPVAGEQPHATHAQTFPESISLGALTDPVSIEALPDDTVLILDAASPSIVFQFKSGELFEEIALDGNLIEPFSASPPRDYFRPAYDFAFLPLAKSAKPAKSCGCGSIPPAVTTSPPQAEKIGDLYIVTHQGNQTIRFEVQQAGDALQFATASLDFFPMRLFSGMGVVNGGGQIFYDSNRRWVPLVRQGRPQYVERAGILTREFDGRDPGCVWHRVMLDACLPPETGVEVWSRASDELNELDATGWRLEPSFYQRGNGSELPFMPKPVSKDAGTFELLFQNARGRYLQLKLVLFGNGRSTPRLSALRIYYPRFSYLKNYLPSVYRADDKSASFLDRFLANVEGTNTAIEDRIAAVQMLFDVRSAPADALEWLARWFGLVLDPAWDEPRRRLFIQHAMDFFQWRGTVRGLQMALRLAFDDCVDETIFAQPGTNCRCTTGRYRVVEKFLLRRPPLIEFDVSEKETQPQRVNPSEPWTPNSGAEDLRRRYAERIGQKEGSDFRKDWAPFDLTLAPNAEQAAAHAGFAQRVLGFVPSPIAPDETKRRFWQDFLIRRYVVVGNLNLKHGTNWASFDAITYLTALPESTALLWDWYQFESVVLPTVANAHRFVVLLPFTGHTLPDVEKRTENLELARRLLEVEKPAHTTFDVKFYWALFRVGEARLGLDSVLDLGGRDPALLPPAVLGHTFLAETKLVATHPFDVAERQIVGRDRLN